MRRPLSLLLLVVAACGGGDGDDAGPTTARVTSTTTTTSVPSTTGTSTTVAAPGTATPAAVAPCPPVPARAEPDPKRPHYTLTVEVVLAENVARGQVSVAFTPDLATDRLVFRLWPNGPRPASAGAHLDVGAVTVDGRAADAAIENPTTLVVRPGRAIGAGETVDVSLPWSLRLPGAVDDRISRSGDAVRLGSFFPILAWEPGVGWALEPPTTGFAEASLAPVADFDVTVTTSPADLTVLTSGVPKSDAPGQFRAEAVRDFALSVGRFTLAKAVAKAPNPVDVTVGVHAGITEVPDRYLGRVVRALEDFANQFGPYPWPSYTLAITPSLGGGIEYPAHVMQGPGTSGRTTSHEVAHMWFYGLVGNNQGRDPWLDEGLASYAEARWENALASFRARSIPSDARGRMDEPMTYWESRQDSYYRGVYVQPVQALTNLGPVDRLDCALRIYVARQAYRITRPPDLLAALETVFPNATNTLAPYL